MEITKETLIELINNLPEENYDLAYGMLDVLVNLEKNP